MEENKKADENVKTEQPKESKNIKDEEKEKEKSIPSNVEEPIKPDENSKIKLEINKETVESNKDLSEDKKDETKNIEEELKKELAKNKDEDITKLNPEISKEKSKEIAEKLEKMFKDKKSKEEYKQLQKKATLFEKHQFWDTQPMPKYADQVLKIGLTGDAIEKKTVEQVRQTPYPLPEGFEWCNIDIKSETEIKELYQLLAENYVEDTGGYLRFNYSIDFLKWALLPKEYIPDWHVGVRVIKNKLLVGFISGIPTMVSIDNKEVKSCEINFLCVHKKLREHRLAPVLIKEVTRRVNIINIWQAIYTAGKYLPTPFCECVYFHRNLNVKKLVETNFTSIPPKLNLKRMEKMYKLPEEVTTPRFRPMLAKDMKAAYELLIQYLSKFTVWIHFDYVEFKHFMKTTERVVYSYVVDDEDGNITDFVSFYLLPSSLLKNEKHKELMAGYLFYYAYTKTELKELVKNCLILAKKYGADVFNCLNLMDNKKILNELQFGEGSGNLMYYLYNWMIGEIKPEELGVVLV